MAAARAQAGVAALGKFMAGRGAPLVDATGHARAQLAGQRGAAGRQVVGAAQAPQTLIDGDGQARGHAAAFVVQFLHRKVHAKARAAGAAGQARVGHGRGGVCSAARARSRFWRAGASQRSWNQSVP